MITRHQLRQEAIKLLYMVEFMDLSVDEIVKSQDDFSQEAIELASNILAKLVEIDKLIESKLVNYTLKRLNAVDRAIIRLAVYEIMSGLDSKIAINEALELTKEYTDLGDKKAVRFNNRLLDNIAKEINK